MSELIQSDQILVGIELSPSKAKTVFLSQNGDLLSSEIFPFTSEKDTFSQLVEVISHLKSKAGTLEKVGMAVPGLVSRQTNRIVFSTHLPEQAEIDFVTELKERTNLAVVLENDANAAAYGEYRRGAGQGCRNLFYVTLGDGVGGAFIFNGEIWHGTAGFAGEFGYITLNSEGMKLEEVASAQNIIRRIKNRFHQDSTSSLNSIGEDNITIADVVREANKGDSFAQMMLERTGTFVGTAVAGVINLLNIERVIIGGEVMEAGKYVLGGIMERAKENSFVPSFQTTQILAGALGSRAAAVGAALLAKETN